MLTAADDILKVSTSKPWLLFGAIDETSLKGSYHDLARIWHPDSPDGNEAVFQHISSLRDAAAAMLRNGSWLGPCKILYRDKSGSAARITVKASFEDEFGLIHVSNRFLTHVGPTADFLFGERAFKVIEDLTYADSRMERSIRPIMPTLVHAPIQTETATVFFVTRPARTVRLRDALNAVGNRLEPKHVAWILSRLCNIACYLEWAGLMHGSLSLDSCFIDPADHNVHLIGGWWFAVPFGTPIEVLPPRTVEVMPAKTRRTHEADHGIDLECIKRLGRELLGDEQGSRFFKMTDVPPPMAHWLKGPAGTSGRDMFEEWQNVLDHAFGPRKFVELNLAADQIYQ